MRRVEYGEHLQQNIVTSLYNIWIKKLSLSSFSENKNKQETAKDGMTGLQSGNIMGKEQT